MSGQNPYQPPQSNVAMPPMPGQVDSLLPAPRRVGIGAAIDWLGDGWRLFKRDFGMWLLIDLIMIVLIAIIAIVGGMVIANLPTGIGTVINALFEIAMTVFITLLMAGLFIGMHESYRGGALDAGHLFAAMKQHLVPLVILGVISAVLSIALAWAFEALWQAPSAENMSQEANPEAMGLMMQEMFSGRNLLIGFIYFMLSVLISLLLWFAQPLVVLNNVPPIEALKLSLQGSLKNIFTLILYTFISLLITFGGALLLLLGLLIVFPWLFCASYFSYRNIFLQ